MAGIDQKRAEFAYECAQRAKELNKAKEYKAYVKKLPMMIKTNGLGATLAFVKSKISNDNTKAGYAYKQLYEDITSWLKFDEKNLIALSEEADLVQEIVKSESPVYRALTVEILAFLNWLRRFAEGLIEGEVTDAN